MSDFKECPSCFSQSCLEMEDALPGESPLQMLKRLSKAPQDEFLLGIDTIHAWAGLLQKVDDEVSL